MKKSLLLICVAVLFFSFLGESKVVPQKQKDINDGVYIVYMGAAPPSSSNGGAMRKDQYQLITSLTRRKRSAVLNTYTKGFSGFAARLTDEEARSIEKMPGVVSVFPDPILQLHTTRSWDFLDSNADKNIINKNNNKNSTYKANDVVPSHGSDIIIGFLDTGIWPESPSFDDDGMGPIPARWKGTCEKAKDFDPAINCNRKLIGARYYTGDSPRDHVGHGTHVSSTAAGAIVNGASYYGLANGTAKGGSPSSRIAMYKVCDEFGCTGAAIMQAFDDAISDGVDVLSLSLGGYGGIKPDFSTDIIAIGSFHATEHGIIVVCSAGNSGPEPSSITNDAPWIFTVAASTLDRTFETRVILGDSKVIKGGGIHFGQLKSTPSYNLITGASAKSENRPESDARACLPSSLDPVKAKGNIILCEHNVYSQVEDLVDEIKRVGGAGMILVIVDDEERIMAQKYGDLPASTVSGDDSILIHNYITSTKDPVATILPTTTLLRQQPAPSLISFSSRGPSLATVNLLKPDITAPGVDILAAWPDELQALPGKKPPRYYLISGTSMSCPHTSGLVAAVMAKNPTFSISAIKSAIMTTALQTNNMNAPMTTTAGKPAIPYDMGAGETNPTGALDPGLVYETEVEDYLRFLCATGYNTSKIRLISKTVPKDFKCPGAYSSEESVSQINYPSIVISKLKDGEPKTVVRTVTNVGDEDSVYTPTFEMPSGLKVEVSPAQLAFTKDKKKISYSVTFTASSSSSKKDIYGSITWTSGNTHAVRSPVIISYA